MRLFSTSALCALALGTVPAAALDFGNGFSLIGDVELEYLAFGDGDDATYGFADLTLGWRSQGGGGFGFGADLAVVAIENLDENDGLNTIWGGLVLTTGYGEVTVGKPRPLLKTMITRPLVGGFRLFDLELGSIDNSTIEGLALDSDDVDVLGVTFKGTSGALTYGASYYKLEQGTFEADAIELAMVYQMGKTRFQGGVEILDSTATSADKVILGVTHAEDRWSVGALASSSSQGSTDLGTLMLWGDYSLSDAVTIGAQVYRLDNDGDQDTFYGITGEYGFGSGGFAELGVFADDTGDDSSYQASVGWRF